jgi:deoxyribonuclease V
LSTWPATADELIATQRALAAAVRPPPWHPPTSPIVAGCFACLPRGECGAGAAGDPVWAAAAMFDRRQCTGRASVLSAAGGPYISGLLALRIGPSLEAAVLALPQAPDVLIVDATGYDHPRRSGLAVHLGAVLDLPTLGVTHRTLLATGDWPPDDRSAMSPLLLDGEIVGYWLRTRAGRRPVAVHAGWRTDAATAVRVVLSVARHRTPTPLREARRLARVARARDGRADGHAGVPSDSRRRAV